jgi:cyclopropane fatty-acyl-phospholipid synthase-like methyltransferase
MTGADIYNSGRYQENNPTWHEEDSVWKAEQVFTMLRRHDLAPQTVCEIGCGVGGVVTALAERMPGVEFTGYDISRAAIEAARARAGAGITFVCGDAFEETASFDLALSLDVFEHVPDYLGFLERMRGKAHYKIYHIPLDMNVQAVLRQAPILHARAKVGHLHYFSKETALATLRDSGQEVVDWFYTPSAIACGERTLARRIAAWPRRATFAIAPDMAARVLGGFSLMVLCR